MTRTLLALLFLGSAGNALGQFERHTFYRITAKHSGKCLAVANGVRSLNDGDPVIQWDCIESESNQKWKIIPVNDGYYNIVAMHSQKALTVFGGIVSQGNGAVVQQWAENGGDNQKWEISCVGGGYYKIIAKHSRKALDIDFNGDPGSLGNGPFAQQWDYWGGDNQRWKFTESLTDRPEWLATRTICPSAEVQARLGVDLYTTDAGLMPRTRFRVSETVVLMVENNTPASIYLREALDAARLIREESLQVERLINSHWVPAFPSGICGPREIVTDNRDGTVTLVTPENAPTRLTQLGTTMSFSRRWAVPALIGPGTYRLALDYYGSRDTQRSRGTVCSQTFVVR